MGAESVGESVRLASAVLEISPRAGAGTVARALGL